MNLREKVIKNLMIPETTTTSGHTMIPISVIGGCPHGEPLCMVDIAGVRCAVYIQSDGTANGHPELILIEYHHDGDMIDAMNDGIVVRKEEIIKGELAEIKISTSTLSSTNEYYKYVDSILDIHIDDSRYGLSPTYMFDQMSYILEHDATYRNEVLEDLVKDNGLTESQARQALKGWMHGHGNVVIPPERFKKPKRKGLKL